MDVSVPIMLELDAEVVSKNISIGNGVERGAEAIDADNCGTNQVGWVIVMAMKKNISPARSQCPPRAGHWKVLMLGGVGGRYH